MKGLFRTCSVRHTLISAADGQNEEEVDIEQSSKKSASLLLFEAKLTVKGTPHCDSTVFLTHICVSLQMDKASQRGLSLSKAAEGALPLLFGSHFTVKARSLWNGGLASRLVSDSVQMLNKRLDPAVATRDELCTLEEKDVREGATMSAQAVSALQVGCVCVHKCVCAVAHLSVL